MTGVDAAYLAAVLFPIALLVGMVAHEGCHWAMAHLVEADGVHVDWAGPEVRFRLPVEEAARWRAVGLAPLLVAGALAGTVVAIGYRPGGILDVPAVAGWGWWVVATSPGDLSVAVAQSEPRAWRSYARSWLEVDGPAGTDAVLATVFGGVAGLLMVSAGTVTRMGRVLWLFGLGALACFAWFLGRYVAVSGPRRRRRQTGDPP